MKIMKLWSIVGEIFCFSHDLTFKTTTKLWEQWTRKHRWVNECVLKTCLKASTSVWSTPFINFVLLSLVFLSPQITLWLSLSLAQHFAVSHCSTIKNNKVNKVQAATYQKCMLYFFFFEENTCKQASTCVWSTPCVSCVDWFFLSVCLLPFFSLTLFELASTPTRRWWLDKFVDSSLYRNKIDIRHSQNKLWEQ